MRSFLIVTVRVCAEVWLITVSGKSDAGGVTTGSGRATPVPVSEMTSGPLVASELIVSVAGRAPRALGVKVTSRCSCRDRSQRRGAAGDRVVAGDRVPVRAAGAFGSGAVKLRVAVPVLLTTCVRSALGYALLHVAEGHGVATVGI